ncbi:MAG TPA: DUF881 domain-containing protein [Candidatus Limnocylindria bacterium]|nr:DUF881 domain-containing protein [Candidatus Limnocylindria bacterium]
MAGRFAQLSLFAVAALIGILLVGQLRSQARPIELSSLSAQELSALVETLSGTNVDLSDALAALREQIRDYERAEAQGQSALQLTEENLSALAAFAGLVPVVGQGILIEMEGAFDETAVNDIVHELRNAGAEAIAINDVRITASSVATLQNAEIQIDGVPLGGRIEIEAMGSPEGLSSAIERPGGIKSLLAQSASVTLRVTERSNLRLPATQRDLTPTSAQPVE